MKTTRLFSLSAGVLSAMLVACSHDDGSSSGNGPDSVELPATVTMVVGAYSLPATDSLVVGLPSQLTCDSAGASVMLPETTSRARLRLQADSMFVSLKELSPLIRRITQGPTFSSAVGEFLSVLDTLTIPIVVEAAFAKVSTGSGIQGMWTFTGLSPAILTAFLDSTQKAALAGVVADDEGRPVLFLDFGVTSLAGLFNRAVYGDAGLAGMISDTVYSVTRTRPNDSTWLLVGNSTADSVGVTINQDGDLSYAWQASTFTYLLHPQSCPNPVMPVWLGAILESNRL